MTAVTAVVVAGTDRSVGALFCSKIDVVLYCELSIEST